MRFIRCSLVLLIVLVLMGASVARGEISAPDNASAGEPVTISWAQSVEGVSFSLSEVGGSTYLTGPITIARAPGTYTFVEEWCFYADEYGEICGESDTHVLTVTPSTAVPDSYSEQLEYEFEIRSGDFDGDGYTDFLIDRLTPGAVDGSMQTTIINGHPNGVAGSRIPSGAELAFARTYPVNNDLRLTGTDSNFDGFVDVMILGLQALSTPNTFSYDDLILYASGEPGIAQPSGITAVTETYREFFGNLAESFRNPNFFAQNTSVTLRPTYGFEFICEPAPLAPRRFWDCSWAIVFTGFVPQVSGLGYHFAAPSAKDALDRIENSDFSQGDPWRLLAGAMHTVLNVHSFGYQADGSRRETNYRRGDMTPQDEFAEISTRVLQMVRELQLVTNGIIVPPPPQQWQPHRYDVATTICSATSDTPVVEGTVPGSGGPAIPPIDIIRTIPASICTIENVWCWAKRQPAPRDDRSDVSTAVNGGMEDLHGFFSPNPIVTWIDDNRYTYVNQTLSGHVLHDELADPECANVSDLTDISLIKSPTPRCSFVQRRLFQGMGEITMVTVGEGYNRPLMGTINEEVGKRIFKGVDEWIQRRLAIDGACVDDP